MGSNDTIILSLGGSLIYPYDGIDVMYLRHFSDFIRKHVNRGKRFFIICGGGNVARNYQNIAQNVITTLASEDIDWLGIHATRINGHLLRTVFSDIAHPRVVENYSKKIENLVEPVIIAAGWKPGWSTDYCATILARDYQAKKLINLSNIDTLYTKDPKKYKDAKPITEICWDEFTQYSGDKWTPGANVPFDPVATKLAKKIGLTVIITNGKNLDNLDHIIAGKPFVGTTIRPFKLDQAFFDQAYFQGKKGENKSALMKTTAQIRIFYRALLIKQFIKPKKVLDVGCGIGYFVRYLRSMGVEAYGIDSSQYAISHPLPEVKNYIQEGDIHHIPFTDNSFDLVTSFDVLEHIPKQDLTQAIAECTRVTRSLQFHKIYTKNNLLLHVLHGYDPSHVSVLETSWWANFWKKNHLKLLSPWWLKLPTIISTTFLLKK